VSGLLAVLLSGVAVVGGLTVLTRDPLRQAITASVFGLLLGATFFAVQAPDVALSEIVVAGVGVPVMLLLAIAKIGAQQKAAHEEDDEA